MRVRFARELAERRGFSLHEVDTLTAAPTLSKTSRASFTI
mgnify:CR=1 FL=1